MGEEFVEIKAIYIKKNVVLDCTPEGSVKTVRNCSVSEQFVESTCLSSSRRTRLYLAVADL